MSIVIPVTVTQVDAYSVMYYWSEFVPDSNGAPVEVWAFPHHAWHLTGFWTVNTDNASIHIMGSNDSTCWSRFHTLDQPSNADDPPEWDTSGNFVRHNYTDSAFDGSHLPRTRWLMPRRPRDGGTHKDLGVFLFATRPFGNRP